MKVDNGRMDIAINFPVYGSVIIRLNLIEDPTCKTAWTDGVSIGYNVDYVASLSHEQIIGLFVHEALHVMLKHPLRAAENSIYKAQHTRYNYACDYALNPIIKRTPGMDIHPNWLYEQKWDDDLAEEIFHQLPEDPRDQMYGNAGDQPGEVRPWPGVDADGNPKTGGNKPTQAEIDAAKNEIDRWVRAAEMKAQGAGKLDIGTKEVIKKATANTVKWEDELQFLCETIVKNDYTWKRPNNKYVPFDVYLPSMDGTKSSDMIFFIDTSGSLGTTQLRQIMGEVRTIIESFNIRVIVIYWNTGFRGVEIFEPEDVLEPTWVLNAKSGGGTSFEGCWDWLEENVDEYDIEPEAIVFFSDLECSDYPDYEPDMPVIWAQVPDYYGSFDTSYLHYLPDYGSHVKIPIYRK
jgi:predicted metal-dependent peptidase